VGDDDGTAKRMIRQNSSPQMQSDPEGGIPSGSLEVFWKVRSWWSASDVCVSAEFFRLMSSIVSFVSSDDELSARRKLGI
jgi:hypothetical protein